MTDKEIKGEIENIINFVDHDRVVDKWVEIIDDHVEIYFKVKIDDEKRRAIPLTIPKHIMETELMIGEPVLAIIAGLRETLLDVDNTNHNDIIIEDKDILQ